MAGTVATQGSKKVASVRYGLARGQTVTLDVIGDGYQQTIARKLAGTTCRPGVSAPRRTSAQSRCATIRFTPTFGYKGPRTLQATVYDADGAIVDLITWRASRHAPRPSRPARR